MCIRDRAHSIKPGSDASAYHQSDVFVSYTYMDTYPIGTDDCLIGCSPVPRTAAFNRKRNTYPSYGTGRSGRDDATPNDNSYCRSHGHIASERAGNCHAGTNDHLKPHN